MILSGLAKLTLLDYPGRTACTIFTGGCNLRCPFCHNALLVVGELSGGDIDEKEVFDHLKKRTGVLDGVCITGGEPLLQKDITDFVSKIKDLGYSVKVDTNGFYPDKLKELVESGLVDYVAMDIKNSKEKYAVTTGIKNLDITPMTESVDYLMSQDKIPYEFRTTVVKEFHEMEDFVKIGDWLSGASQYFLQAFSDKGELIESGLSGWPKEKMEEFLQIVSQKIEKVAIRGI